MEFQRKALSILRIFSDLVIIALVLTAMTTIFAVGAFSENGVNLFVFISSILFIWLIFAWKFKVYDEFHSRILSNEINAVLKSISAVTIALIILIYFNHYQEIPRLFTIYTSVSILILISTEKIIIRKVLNEFRKRGRNLRSILIIGVNNLSLDFFNALRKNKHLGYYVIGFLDSAIDESLNGKYLGNLSKLENILELSKADNVIIAKPNLSSNEMNSLVDRCENYTTRVKILTKGSILSNSFKSVTRFENFNIASLSEDRLNNFYSRLLKRIFDLFFAAFILIFIFSWLAPIIAIGIKLSSKGPVFYKQERWGRNNKIFKALKFRTMFVEYGNREDIDFKQVTKVDPRVTKFGRFLRRKNLDELPQFWNVLKGEMSVVGPRPHPTQLNLDSKDRVIKYMQRHLVKTGITGWAQVNGFRGETKDIDLMQKRVNFDLWYIRNWSFFLDLKIIVITVLNFIKGEPNAY